VLTQWKSAYSAPFSPRKASVRRISSSVDIPVDTSIGFPVAATYSISGKFVMSGEPIL
jgi:hypothetical protein